MVVDGDGDGDDSATDVDSRRQRRVLSFQNLDVYRCAVEFLARAVEVSARMPKGYAPLSDQLRRAALSGPLNIAEAAGRTSERDGARHYGIARGSAMECAAIVDALKLLEVVTEEEHRAAVELLARIVAMLTKLCR